MEAKEKEMRPLNTFGVQFLIRQDKEKNGKVPVYARITVNGEITHFALKQWIEPKHWDPKRGYGKGSKDEVVNINNGLEQIRVALGNHYQQLQLKGKYITPNAIKDAYLGNNDEVPNTLNRLISFHFETAKEVLEWSTLKHYKVTERYLVKFLETKFKKTDIFLNEINYKCIVDFETFLRRHKPADHQKPLNNNGVMKHLLRLRKMTNLAVKLEWIPTDPFKNYKFKFDRVDKDFLNDFELRAIENKIFDLERLTIVRDVFLFCCYTGLAYVDVLNLSRDNIVIGIDGGDWIKTCRQKSKIPVTTPLLPKAKLLVIKYAGHYRDKKLDHVFPVFSNQKVNSYLKEIATACGIKKNLTSHVARHTFATTVTLSNGVPIETVSKMLGHTKIATTQIYARVLEKKIGEDMGVLKKKLISNEHVLVDAGTEIDSFFDCVNQPESCPGKPESLTPFQIAHIETEKWIAPILRENNKFKGLRISIDRWSYQEYLDYRLGGNFQDWEEFYVKGRISNVVIYYIGNSDLVTEATELLNNSRYLKEGKIKINFEKILFDNGMFRWMEI